VGLALFPDDAAQGEDLLRLADAAMYVAKKAGRDGWRLYGDLTEADKAMLARPD
jgi:GGDEF domain-containing protein